MNQRVNFYYKVMIICYKTQLKCQLLIQYLTPHETCLYKLYRLFYSLLYAVLIPLSEDEKC